ncbi:hypothetical protein GIB67_019762 [Kingdonia uniflora]|uniref:AMP-binding enzyme C-terminal domain-containing protein n=1 Tax=Kingdonia uniflora TaxID=39325 RepID=A0A7J7MK31_9MAGN|nr:hypothetical protein GIB67_019762 [Kingdonia uniflora]
MQTSAVEIERVCDGADESIVETAAISIAPVNGGPEELVILVVLKEGLRCKPDQLKTKFSRAIQKNLNPLFKVSYVKIVSEFPRTATNKLLRRVLRDQIKHELALPRQIIVGACSRAEPRFSQGSKGNNKQADTFAEDVSAPFSSH